MCADLAIHGGLALRAPRRHLCLPLPAGFTPPTSPATQELLRSAVSDAVGLSALTAVYDSPAPNVWLCAFFHGADRIRHAATYERGAPGSVAYIPRNAETILADWKRGLLYLSAPDRVNLHDLALAMNRTLFPDRRPAQPFRAPPFDLAPLRFLTPSDRRPACATAPWESLALKALTWQDAGEDFALSRRLWSGDGFDALEASGEPLPAHVLSVAFAIRPRGARHVYTAELYAGEPTIRATLSPATLPALAELVSLARA